VQFRQKTALLSCCLKTSFDLLTSILLYHIDVAASLMMFQRLSRVRAMRPGAQVVVLKILSRKNDKFSRKFAARHQKEVIFIPKPIYW
jgi:hypothetical protein